MTLPLQISKQGKIRYLVDENNCWIWQLGVCGNNGEYGSTRDKGKRKTAHRFFYEQLVEEVNSETHVHHKCSNTLCVNPDHLETVNKKQHIRLHNLSRPRKTHCKNGHEFNEENTYWRKDGGRHCRVCDKERRRIIAACTRKG